MSTEGYKTTSAGKINASYTNNDVVNKLTSLEPACHRDNQLPVLKTIKMFFIKKAELDTFTDTDILFTTQELVIDCKRKLLEWESISQNSLKVKFDELTRQRNELWLAKNHPSEALKTQENRDPGYRTTGEGAEGGKFPNIAHTGFKNPYDRDPDIVTKIDQSVYTGSEVKLLLAEVNKVVFQLSGEEQAAEQLKYINNFNDVDLKLTQIKELDNNFGSYKQFLKQNHDKHVQYLIQEKQLEQLEKEISDLAASIKL
jgi:hypothetical protein